MASSTAPSTPAPDPRPTRSSWLTALLPAGIALLVVTGLLLAGAAVVSRGIDVVGGLLSGG